MDQIGLDQIGMDQKHIVWGSREDVGLTREDVPASSKTLPKSITCMWGDSHNWGHFQFFSWKSEGWKMIREGKAELDSWKTLKSISRRWLSALDAKIKWHRGKALHAIDRDAKYDQLIVAAWKILRIPWPINKVVSWVEEGISAVIKKSLGWTSKSIFLTCVPHCLSWYLI